jgi:8-oxo-dGTP pyrophosphatase MutT (NUDIX family)
MKLIQCSVLVISPTNQVLLLHRVKQASSFAAAHVFPGGALSKTHDGAIPDVNDPGRHQDGPAYRMAAIRETFEESGILLAKSKKTGKLFTDISDEEREEGRSAVHAGKVKFAELLEKWGATPDTEALIPFTRWVTPPNVPKRFTTQMYIYFLPLGSTSPTKKAAPTGTPPGAGIEEEDEIVIPNPTHDGGIEHTAARFLPPNKWIDLARQNRIILFPPQFFLTLMLAPYLSSTVTSPSSPTPSPSELQLERQKLLDFLSKPRLYDGKPEVSFAEACISPIVLGKGEYGEAGQDGVGGVDKHTAVLVLDGPGKEVEALDQTRRGIREWVVTTKFKGEGPRDVDVRRREDVLGKGKGKL